ncbi:hypothetical protein CDV31_009438 [Fusarium ambrosium]|uniref:Uncharacterized protein n=1 Tax=Fusarium ambrosium TaxID=131363 RepID=A0A428TUM9_9HYPO|nr:hypothetical protein CDV31_009438 [Fusarium ambrosium]
MSDKLSFIHRVTNMTMQTRKMKCRKETIEIPKRYHPSNLSTPRIHTTTTPNSKARENRTNMCTLIYRKYDCTKCQRRVRDDKWIEECERVRTGIKGTCEAKFEHETSYVPADECVVCEMERRKKEEEEEKKAEQDAMEQSGCSTS